ncbi:MAG: Lrp/AsnC ligand binding domain-containing protein [Thermodesulfobacteriota bacterium]
MAVEAYVFIECEHSKSKQVYDRISRIAGVQRIDIVTGPYDIIAIVTASNFKVLGEVVIDKIQSAEYVKKTLTNVIVE